MYSKDYLRLCKYIYGVINEMLLHIPKNNVVSSRG